MVYMANCGTYDKGAMFYNVDQPVGAQGPKRVRNIDTELVQWMLRQLGYFGAEGDRFTGENDDDTINAITQFQLANGPFPPDGTVSVAHGVSYGAQHAPYTIVRLNYFVRDKYRFTGWPAINQLPNVLMPPLLWGRIARLLGNSSNGG